MVKVDMLYLAYKISLLLFKSLYQERWGGREESKFLSLFWSVGRLSVALLCFTLLLVTIYVPLVVLPTRSLAHPNQNQAVTMETPPQQQPSTTTNQHTENKNKKTTECYHQLFNSFCSFHKSERSDISANVVDICLCVNVMLSWNKNCDIYTRLI